LSIEPPPSRWAFPPAEDAPARAPLGIGADLEPGTLIAAYRAGIFPWPDDAGRLLWWSPDPRAVLPLDRFHESRSLRRTRRHFVVTRDRAFADVMRGCGSTHGPTWITPGMLTAYVRLHELGWAHSIEVWRSGELAGGVYGVALGGLFAGESMCTRLTDGGKAALVFLAQHLRQRGYRLFDIQMVTPLTVQFHPVHIPRAEYLRRLPLALRAGVSFVPELAT